jgi:hypothetical protein
MLDLVASRSAPTVAGVIGFIDRINRGVVGGLGHGHRVDFNRIGYAWCKQSHGR